jgi:hypothetical protein
MANSRKLGLQRHEQMGESKEKGQNHNKGLAICLLVTSYLTTLE